MNLDPNRSTDAGKLETLCSRKTKVLSEITTTRFTQLDHILLNCIKFSVYFTTSFINYTTDHHLLSSRIAKEGNTFNSAFLHRLSCNADKETKSKSKSERMKETFDTKTTREQSEKVRSRERQQMDSGSQAEVDLTCFPPPKLDQWWCYWQIPETVKYTR